MTLFRTVPQEHLQFARHLTAESRTEEFVPGKGVVTKWERIRKQNHWFDALYGACAAAHYAGVRLLEPKKVPVKQAPPRRESNERPFIDLDRWRQSVRF